MNRERVKEAIKWLEGIPVNSGDEWNYRADALRILSKEADRIIAEEGKDKQPQQPKLPEKMPENNISRTLDIQEKINEIIDYLWLGEETK